MHRKIALSRGRKHRFHLRVERHDWLPKRDARTAISAQNSGWLSYHG